MESEPPAGPALVCGVVFAVIAGTVVWFYDAGTITIILCASVSWYAGWMYWTYNQWADMTTKRLMSIEERLDEIEREEP